MLHQSLAYSSSREIFLGRASPGWTKRAASQGVLLQNKSQLSRAVCMIPVKISADNYLLLDFFRRHFDSDCSDTDFRDSSSDSSDYDAYNDRVYGETLRSHTDSGSCDDGIVVDFPDNCKDCKGGRLIVEYYERDAPHLRVPLADKARHLLKQAVAAEYGDLVVTVTHESLLIVQIIELTVKCPSVKTLTSAELHPSSWMSIAW